MRGYLLTLLTLTALVTSTGAYACGDSLYRVGKNVSYRVYTAPLPGSVLVYGHTDEARQLAEALARSGHGVHFVDDSAALTTELQSGGYDVVIAPYGDRNVVESNPGIGGATFLPVVSSSKEIDSARAQYDQVMNAEKDEIKHFLKAIHRTLKRRA